MKNKRVVDGEYAHDCTVRSCSPTYLEIHTITTPQRQYVTCVLSVTLQSHTADEISPVENSFAQQI